MKVTGLTLRKEVCDEKSSLFFWFNNNANAVKKLLFFGKGRSCFCPIILPKNDHLKSSK